LNPSDKIMKRLFDVVFSFFGIVLTGWIIVLLCILIYLETFEFPIFMQERFGRNGIPFLIYKIKTMKSSSETKNDKDRVTRLGKMLRKYKLDELPQFINVLKGDMSMVGPRPDFLSLLDELKEEDKIILSIKPGITGPASIYFMNEEEILANQKNLEKYNKEVIWPKKVEINKKYIANYSFVKDLEYIMKTIVK
jgi:lipopolysaccharide/colanic/teichoic acid biosynthesis glycosyltransferase